MRTIPTLHGTCDTCGTTCTRVTRDRLCVACAPTSPAPWLDTVTKREDTMARTIADLDYARASHYRALRRAADLLTGALTGADAGRSPVATIELVIDDIMREIR